MTTALAICQKAYKRQKLNNLTGFSDTNPFPYNLALDLLNEVIRSMNRLGSFYFMETKTALPYSPATSTYDLSALSIDPRRIDYVRAEATDKWGTIKQYSLSDFQRLFQSSTIQTTKPTGFTKHNTTLYLNTIPDADYSLYVYHYQDMPLITTEETVLRVPERDEDVVIEAIYQFLGFNMKRWDYATAFNVLTTKVNPLLVSLNRDAGMPRQMPAAF